MMDTSALKRFAQAARRQLIEQVAARLDRVLSTDSAELREKEQALKQLNEQIKATSRDAVIERVAYTWFNRFCALRFMDANRYTRLGIVSPAEERTQPEILAEAKQGYIHDSFKPFLDSEKIFALLSGRRPSSAPQQEAYRLLLVGVCNYYHNIMRFLFPKIDDYTELLMPEDLLSENAVLTAVRETLSPDNCRNVEVIGWLYQFYISEKKDEVFAGLKKGKKITPQNIPAATQLFTPHWIVRYLVENSLGRLWMLNRPQSKLKEKMEYYIEPEEPETDFLRITQPEEIRICDPACGSGHMLTYAFDLLYNIYEEEGTDPTEIPRLILEKNLYGIEIDERAGELAAFALVMKAREKYKRFFSKPVQPSICVLQNIVFDEDELENYMDEMGRDLFTIDLQATLQQFEESDNFGSLIRPVVMDVEYVREILKEKDLAGNLFLRPIHDNVLMALKQVDYLKSKYHVVVTNPPYMGKGMNARLKIFAKAKYSQSKSDLFAMFIVRNLELAQKQGIIAMITMQSWMFLSSFEQLRTRLLEQNTILSMVHLGARAFDTIGGEVVSTTAFVLVKNKNPIYEGVYLRLVDGNSEVEKQTDLLEAIKNPNCGLSYRSSSGDFKKIPGNPIGYWLSNNSVKNCEKYPPLAQYSEAKSGMSSCNSNLFLRQWFEVSAESINRRAKSHADATKSNARWYPYNKGGGNRRWFGYNDVVINWANEGQKIKNFVVNNPKDPNTTHWSRRLFNLEYFFRDGLTWSAVTSGKFSCRAVPLGVIPGTGSKTIYDLNSYVQEKIFSFLNSKLSSHYLSVFSPTLNFEAGDVAKLPVIELNTHECFQAANLVKIAKFDWDTYETSWDFNQLPLLESTEDQSTLINCYRSLRANWQKITMDMKRLEEENNRIFIEAYGLQDELTPKVSKEEITLTCNPHYRYGGNKSEEELEALLLADTIKEFISYAVGCMFGRYSLDKPGLILANQGETIEDYLAQVPEPSFNPDDDNVIPVLERDWFTDDITERFRKFLRITFGEEHYEENLAFIEQAIGKDIRKYFIRDFYNDHVKRYKKRPIYWLFSSPKGSFNALIYMHRYRPDTVSVVLNDYLREFRTKLAARKSHLEQVSISASASQRDKTRALKEIDDLDKMIRELEEYERDVLYPLATKQVEIDLDDGVKVNYNKFGQALKKMSGLCEN